MKKPSLAVLVAALVLLSLRPGAPPAAAGGGSLVRLPLIFKAPSQSSPTGCPAGSGNGYAAGPAFQRDTDNPVRLAWNHADKNLALRGYASTNAARVLVDHGADDPNQPPQLATLFNPNRVPTFSAAYRAYTWNWAPSPNPGSRGGLITDWAVTVLGLRTTQGEALRVPTSDYDIGGGMEVIVLFADADSVAFKYTRDDSVGPNGYTLHVDNLCTDPNLLAVYAAHDGGARYVYGSGSYNLPNLPAGQVFGTARGSEIRVAIVDSGAFMDPRSCNEWWQVRPGANC
jgi:hypothetical protein